MLTSGSLFANRFEIDRPAGRGGMGTVYRARDLHTGDWVALKLLHGGPGGPDDAQRFAREAQLLAELRHPGIVSHIAHGQTPEGLRFLAMEWLAGEDLGQRLLGGPLPLGQCVKLLKEVAAALAVAHQRRIVHRDRTHKHKIWLRNGYSTVHRRRTAPRWERRPAISRS